MGTKAQLRKRVYNKFGGRCSYCGMEIDFKKFQVDHAHPKCSKFYSALWKEEFEEKVEAFENLMPTCRKCNHYKRQQNIEEFRQSMITLHERLKRIYILEVATNFGMTDIKPFNGKFYFETL